MSDILHVKKEISHTLLYQSYRASENLHVFFSASESPPSNIYGVGVGKKIVSGKATNTTCIRIYVKQKLPPSQLSKWDHIPRDYDGFPTDVVESPQPQLLNTQNCTAHRKKRQKPLIAGISAGHFAIGAGTIACFVRSIHPDDDPETVYVLSNNHVFADVNEANIGDALYQPGSLDGGNRTDTFAKLHRFIPIGFGNNINKVDAAIGTLLPGMKYVNTICEIGDAPKHTQKAEDGIHVCKHGRTTGYTEGIVTDMSYDGRVRMGHSIAVFEDQIRIDSTNNNPIAHEGDSGSLIVSKNDEQNAVGLLFAGPEDGSYTLANHIDDVLTDLQIELM